MNSKFQDSIMKQIYTDEILDEFKLQLKLIRDSPTPITDAQIDSYIETLRRKVK